MSGFVAFANVKARGSIEQAARFLGLKPRNKSPAAGALPETTEALAIGYAPKGMMKGQAAIPIRLPTANSMAIWIHRGEAPVRVSPFQCGEAAGPRKCGRLDRQDHPLLQCNCRS